MYVCVLVDAVVTERNRNSALLRTFVYSFIELYRTKGEKRGCRGDVISGILTVFPNVSRGVTEHA